MRMFDATNRESFVSGESFPSDAEIRCFLHAYLEECWRLGSISRAEGENKESVVDRLLREALIGCMTHTLFAVESVLASEASEMLAAVPAFCTGLAMLVREYRRVKQLLFPALDCYDKLEGTDSNSNRISSVAKPLTQQNA